MKLTELDGLKEVEDPNLIKLGKIIHWKQEKLKRKLRRYLEKMGMPVKENLGYLYAAGDLPILLVAHLDTYTNKFPKTLKYVPETGIIYSEEGSIGGDDRCGVYAILKILESVRPHVLFTEGEEIGGLGAVWVSRYLEAPPVKYIMELDRRGYDDCAFYQCGNMQFREYIESFGFKTVKGTASDVSTLGPAWDIAAVNVSAGYYNEHTTEEYINYDQLENIITQIKAILEHSQNVPYFHYQNNFESFKTSKYIDLDDKVLDAALSKYTMLIDCGASLKQVKQEILIKR